MSGIDTLINNTDPANTEKVYRVVAPPLVPYSHPGSFCRNRLFEWMTALMMLGIAAVLIVSPNSISQSNFRLMLEVGFSQSTVLFLFLLFGLTRVIALYFNGSWKYGYRTRAACALGGSFVWVQMVLALAGNTYVTGTISPGVPVYTVLVIGELISCYRAVRDERFNAANNSRSA